MRHLAITLCFVVFSLGYAYAEQRDQSASKRAWEWTFEERLAARFDAAAIRKRLDAVGQRSQGVGTAADVIDGRRNPELLLPSEIFRRLLRIGFTGSDESKEIFRESYGKKAIVMGLPPNFWETLEGEASAYLHLQQREHELLTQRYETKAGRDRANSELGRLRQSMCFTRAESLSRIRTTLGPEKFDRFLYEAGAPEMGITIVRLSDPATLRFEERGCR